MRPVISTTKAASLVICTLGVFAVTQARAETIDFTFTTPTGPVVVSIPSSGSVGTAALNALLAVAGSTYTFSSLSAVSNFPGTATSASLLMTGGISNMGATSSLTITETASGFTLPSGGPATLSNATSARFTAPAGDTQTTHGSVNSTVTPALILTSTGGLNSQSASSGPVPVPSFSTPFTLDNEITFSLSASGSSFFSDSTVLSRTVPPAVPEPSSLVLLGAGLLCWLGVGLVVNRPKNQRTS